MVLKFKMKDCVFQQIGWYTGIRPSLHLTRCHIELYLLACFMLLLTLAVWSMGCHSVFLQKVTSYKDCHPVLKLKLLLAYSYGQ